MKRALLVDIDDTVVDWIGPARDAVIATVATHPALAGSDPNRVADRFLEIVEETHALWMNGSLSVDGLRAERIRRLVAESGADLDVGEAAHLASAYRDAYLAARRPVAGAAELLAEVRRRGARVVAVTNNLVSEQEASCGTPASDICSTSSSSRRRPASASRTRRSSRWQSRRPGCRPPRA